MAYTKVALVDLGVCVGGTTPYGTEFFHFRIHFHEKHPCRRSTSPLMGARPSYGKSWIRHWVGCVSWVMWPKWTTIDRKIALSNYPIYCKVTNYLTVKCQLMSFLVNKCQASFSAITRHSPV